MMRIRRAFTLIELLTVMAMTAILLGLIIIPLVQSFNLTRAAQAFSDAQDRARLLQEKLVKEIGNAYGSRTGNQFITTVNGIQKKVSPGTTVISLVKPSGGLAEIVLPSTKLDLILPAEGDQSQVATGQFTNLDGRLDPTIKAPKGQVVVPVAPGFAMVRYFIGRRDPMVEYNNPYDGLLMIRNGLADNLYVLYRIEVQPLVRRAGTGTNGDISVAWRPNTEYFESDPVTDMKIQDIDDPKFFEPNRVAGTNVLITADAKADRIRKWLSHSVVQTEVSRYDMIQPVYDLRTQTVNFEPNPTNDPALANIPKIVPLVQFRPERISNDPATGHVAVRQNEESAASEAAGPDVYSTQYAQWASFVIRTYPRGWDPDPVANSDPNPAAGNYEVGLSTDRAGDPGYAPGFSIYVYDHTSVDDFDIDFLKQNEVFDVAMYQELASLKGQVANDQIYPFSSAVMAANSRSNFLGTGAWNSIFTPYNVDPARGLINTSVSLEEVGNPSVPPTMYNNLPFEATSLTAAYTPATDPNVNAVGSKFTDATFQSINDRFNKIYHDYPELLPNRVHRFMDLRVRRQSDGTWSPLFPNKAAGLCTGFTYDTQDDSYRNRVQIVPGSEVIYGPDQLPGPHQGQAIRYSRVTTGEPGPNQYKINYADVQEPLDNTNKVTPLAYANAFGLTLGEVAGFNPKVYDPTNFVSAILQPRFKAGYVQFNSDPNIPLPFDAGNPNTPTAGFRVSYRFQFTGTLTGKPIGGGRTKVDSFAVDYDSRELISVLLTIRNYPQTSLPNPQSVTLKSTAKVRNYSR